MKNIFAYYLTILAPLAALFGFHQLGYIDPKNLVLLFLFYIFIYRTYVDGLRLVAKNLISKKDIWRLILPGSRSDYLVQLYFDSEVEEK